MKFIIHTGDMYYPDAEEFDSIESAVERFEALRKNRLEEIEHGCLFFRKDYLCIVIDEIDVENIKVKIGLVKVGDGCESS